MKTNHGYAVAVRLVTTIVSLAALGVHQGLQGETDMTAPSRQLTPEQASAFEEFRRNGGIARDLSQTISDFVIQEGVSADAVRNYLGQKKKMSAEEKREYEKGSDFKAQQRQARLKQRMAEHEKRRRANELQRQKDQREAEKRKALRDRQREELANNATIEEISKILRDEGMAKSYVSIRDKKRYGRKLTENEMKFFEEKTGEIGREIEKKKRMEYRPLHEPYKPTKAEQRDIDAANRESRRLQNRRRRR